MTIIITALAVAAVAAIISTIVEVARDGYRQA